MVKDSASKAILTFMSHNSVVSHFEDKEHQKQTICCTIKELLLQSNNQQQSYLHHDIISFLNQLLIAFGGPL